MSKYQEALDIIVEKTDMLNNTCLHLPKCMKNGICHYVGEGLCEDYERVKLLQELVDKETPVKPKKYRDNLSENPRIPFFEEWYFCPKCEENVGDNFYCPHCGQKIDWSDEE